MLLVYYNDSKAHNFLLILGARYVWKRGVLFHQTLLAAVFGQNSRRDKETLAAFWVHFCKFVHFLLSSLFATQVFFFFGIPFDLSSREV